VTEAMRIDWSKHSLFGAGKVAANEVMQEYGRYFGMKTDCLRARLSGWPESFRC
jgi:CDP-paratose 2-epimerase